MNNIGLSPLPARAKPKHLLIVDDDSAALRKLVRVFHREGFEVHAARNGLEALATLEHQPIDALITDDAMPLMDGVCLIQEVRQDPRRRSLPVFLLSARPTRKLQDQALRNGAGLVLPKPLNYDQLVTLVRFAT